MNQIDDVLRTQVRSNYDDIVTFRQPNEIFTFPGADILLSVFR